MTLQVERQAWSDEARDGLLRTFNHAEAESEFREAIETGRYALWRVSNASRDALSWAITETHPDRLFVWAYQGRNLRGFTQALCDTCRRAGIAAIEFYTLKRGLPRLLRAFAPVLVREHTWRICSS